MNRNKEWDAFIYEIKSYVPSQLEHSAQNAVLRMKNRRNISLLITTPLASIVVIFIVFKTLGRVIKPAAITTGR